MSLSKKESKKVRELLKKIDNLVPLGANWVYVEKLIKSFLFDRENRE